MTTINLHRDDIILVPFPLSAPSPTKRRPAVVVSSDHYNSSTGEVIIAPITSRGRALPRVGDYSLLDWQEEGLHATATIRARFVTIRSSHVFKTLGKLSRRDSQGLGQWIRRVLEL